MDKSTVLVLSMVAVATGFALLAVVSRSLWVNYFYVPPKRKRRSRAGINLKDK
jgi:hypothetical protein